MLPGQTQTPGLGGVHTDLRRACQDVLTPPATQEQPCPSRLWPPPATRSGVRSLFQCESIQPVKPKANPTPASGCSLSHPWSAEAQPWAPCGGGAGLRKAHRLLSPPCLPPPLCGSGSSRSGGRGPRPVVPLVVCPDASGGSLLWTFKDNSHRPLLLRPSCPQPVPGCDHPLGGHACPAAAFRAASEEAREQSAGSSGRAPPDELCLRAAPAGPAPATPGAAAGLPAHRRQEPPLLSQELLKCPRPAGISHGGTRHLLHKSPGFKETPGVPSPPALLV